MESILPGGLIQEKIPNLKKRQRSYYYRQVDGKWERTELLPSDVEGRAYYESKGFTLRNPLEGGESALNNTSDEKDGIINTLQDEIASLRKQLEDKGKQEGSGKAGRPKKKGG